MTTIRGVHRIQDERAETLELFGDADKEELYRRLAQARRMIAHPLDLVTRERLRQLALDLEAHIAEIEARDADAPPE